MANQDNHKPFLKFLSQERTWIAEVRFQVNEYLDKCQKRIDEAEVRFVKEQEAVPITVNQGNPERE